jgi:probable F420-dependent oxidoreductase
LHGDTSHSSRPQDQGSARFGKDGSWPGDVRLGAVFPQTEAAPDAASLHVYARALEALGYDHLVAYDHVVNMHPARVGDRTIGFTIDDEFHEPLMLFSHLAAVTRRLEFVTGILVLPQRQTVLVAKQAAELDLLSDGRLRLGVGLGWNEAEFEALGQEFRKRGRRLGEQIDLLRALWTQDRVDFHGATDDFWGVGLRPLPKRRIPIWMGGTVDAALKRVAQYADGWISDLFLGGWGAQHDAMASSMEKLRHFLQLHGRDINDIGVECRFDLNRTPPDAWEAELGRWVSSGATHVSLITTGAGLAWPDGHVEQLTRFADIVRR